MYYIWNATVVTRCYHKVPEWARTLGPRMATARRDSPHRGRLPPPNALSPRWATATRGAVRRNKVRSPLGHLWQRLPCFQPSTNLTHLIQRNGGRRSARRGHHGITVRDSAGSAALCEAPLCERLGL